MSGKEKKYKRLYSQIKELLEKDTSFIAQLATINAILYHKNPSFFWVGFYLRSDSRLLVGPYQGPVACLELANSKGVCWAGIIHKKDILVDNVETFPDHITCDSRSKSEVVLPLYNSAGDIVAVLDIDSDKRSNFNEFDLFGLRKILSLINIKFIDAFFTK